MDFNMANLNLWELFNGRYGLTFAGFSLFFLGVSNKANGPKAAPMGAPIMAPYRPPLTAQSKLPGDNTSALAIAKYAATMAPIAPAIGEAGKVVNRRIANAVSPPTIMAIITPGMPRNTVHAATPPAIVNSNPTRDENAPLAMAKSARIDVVMIVAWAEIMRANGGNQRLAPSGSPASLGFIASPLHRLVRDALGLP
jgi:hypothetical protein